MRATNLDAGISVKNANGKWCNVNNNMKAICSTLGKIPVVNNVKGKGFCNKGQDDKMLSPPDVWIPGVYERLRKSNAAQFDDKYTKFLIAKTDFDEGDSYNTIKEYVEAIQALPGYAEGIIPAYKKSHLEQRIAAIEQKLGISQQFDDGA